MNDEEIAFWVPAIVAAVACTLVMTALKWAGALSWPWWVVTAPVWGLVAFLVVAIIAIVIWVHFLDF